jgi:primosomal protein N' (replication factor Y)
MDGPQAFAHHARSESLTLQASSYLEVAFPIPLHKTFHYRLTNGHHQVPIGTRVLAPFGLQKNLVGFVVGHPDDKPPFQTKDIIRILDPDPFIDEKMLELARWMAERYLCSLGEALACVVPPGLEAPKRLKSSSSVDVETSLPVSARNDGNRIIQLSTEQKRALDPILASVDAKAYRPFLLRGITDSGKTELYVRAIDRVVAQNRQALFLLPEIALTPPFFDRLKERYGEDKVGLWHSGISSGQRYRTWTAVRRGEIHVLLGARSAIFAPFPQLGLIVLDEEHETAYKQEDRPRYHTRDVALKRAELSSAVLVMGSATPSLESYWQAKEGAYTLLELTSRVEERSLPPVELIDQRRGRDEKDEGKKGKAQRLSAPFAVFSEPLKLAIENRLARREQILLFVNRRGFTPFLRCSRCGWVSRCPRCSTTMTLHMGVLAPDRYMQCHVCSHREQVPVQCPTCKSMRLHQYGIGTQKVEEEIKKLFPFVKAARLDRDIASKRRQHENIYRAFVKGDLDVLVGTQMIAKGFHFPNVTLVGVVDADVSLHLPDFRSSERTFDLLTQVAGRTGRGEAKGKVMVQTHHPEHYALVAAKDHDYVSFYGQELAHRQALNYPPFCRLVNVVLRTTKEPLVRQAAENLFERLIELDSGASLLGPAPAPYSRLRNQFRYQILLKGTDASLAPLVKFLRSYRPSKAYMTVDVDPADLL